MPSQPFSFFSGKNLRWGSKDRRHSMSAPLQSILALASGDHSVTPQDQAAGHSSAQKCGQKGSGFSLSGCVFHPWLLPLSRK